MKYASLNNSHNNCQRNYMNEIFRTTNTQVQINRPISMSCRTHAMNYFFILGDFYASGTQDAEVTKSLISRFSVHVNYFVPSSIVSWGTKLPVMVWQTVVQKILARRPFGLLGRFWPKYRMAWENSQKFVCELTFEEWVQKFETDDLSLLNSR